MNTTHQALPLGQNHEQLKLERVGTLYSLSEKAKISRSLLFKKMHYTQRGKGLQNQRVREAQRLDQDTNILVPLSNEESFDSQLVEVENSYQNMVEKLLLICIFLFLTLSFCLSFYYLR